jgi:hypothetical protein
MVKGLFQDIEHKVQETAVHIFVPLVLEIEATVAQLDLNLGELQDFFSQFCRKYGGSLVELKHFVIEW